MEINRRKRWKGHLCHERFHSYVMNESHLRAAVRYIELNPVRARLCSAANDWKWSSAAAHLGGQDDGIVDVRPMLERIDNWAQYLSSRETEITNDDIRKQSRSDRPAGDEKFIDTLEQQTQRRLQKLKPGPKSAEFS